MGRRIVMTPPAPDAEKHIFDSPYLPGQGLLQESLYLALIVFGAGMLLLFVPLYLTMPLLEAVLVTVEAVPLVAALSALVALIMAVYRALRYERRERRYMRMMDYQLEQMRREFEDRDTYVDMAGGQEVDSRRWDRLAYDLLRRYYDTLARTGSREAAARAMSRDACVREGICTQKEWNIVNSLLVGRGLRDGRRRVLIPRTFDEAWRIWQEKSALVSGWYVDDDGMWIPKE